MRGEYVPLVWPPPGPPELPPRARRIPRGERGLLGMLVFKPWQLTGLASRHCLVPHRHMGRTVQD